MGYKEMNEPEEDNASKDLIVYSNHELGSIVEKYAGEAGIMAWIDEANDKTEFPELDENYKEKEQDGEGGATYLDDSSDSEVEPLSYGDDESDSSSNDAEESDDEEEAPAPAPITNGKRRGHLVGKRLPRRKCSKPTEYLV